MITIQLNELIVLCAEKNTATVSSTPVLSCWQRAADNIDAQDSLNQIGMDSVYPLKPSAIYFTGC